jgi:hypothetical protein
MIFHRYFYISICFLLVIFFQEGFTQSLLPEDPISSSLANSIIAGSDKISFALNPAQSRADSIHPFRAALAYTPFVGGLKEANQSAIEGTYFSSLAGISFSLNAANLSFSEIYSDLVFGLTVAKQFDLANNRKASTGIRLRYESLSTTPDYPTLDFVFVDLGFTLDLTKEFTLGGAALNLLGAKYEVVNNESEKLEQRFLVGITYQPERFPIKIFTSVEESNIQSLSLQFGAEYIPVTFLALRIGTSTDTGNITTGIGINYSSISFDVGSRFDKALGPIFSFGASGEW